MTKFAALMPLNSNPTRSEGFYSGPWQPPPLPSAPFQTFACVGACCCPSRLRDGRSNTCRQFPFNYVMGVISLIKLSLVNRLPICCNSFAFRFFLLLFSNLYEVILECVLSQTHSVFIPTHSMVLFFRLTKCNHIASLFGSKIATLPNFED